MENMVNKRLFSDRANLDSNWSEKPAFDPSDLNDIGIKKINLI
jgi:hypothetical protein